MSGARLYLASPLGFSPENRPYLDRVKEKLISLGFTLFDPWEQSGFAPAIDDALRIEEFAPRVAAFRRIAAGIGRVNEEGIRASALLLAILDGAEVDSGTASEVGFAAALGKRCYGLRTDLRDCGDFTGVPINLQVLHFIEGSGGKLFRTIDAIDLSP
ncbi:nucleoside 2-deoxyribosyltransferase [Geobacter pickeringii]|uniref:2-deoxyribonucleoside glycosidase n=1 Tax=Geobacter pickeringii TaxID=345632 RepID=A0A0B5BAY4_9BACT|nr:nucleoside 2-deoxyribosyltransferase [Geobacter pickeringii]AJE03923.1 2-deoxyribonucleoside glycosidase [Geobacter pickeringii]